ncbi:hypothetical protein WCE00_01805 [Acinetobacter haemolyticus]|uniref:DUF7210 family protein n=1 Tax=Acinetobacter haemolyticus TaxID=29430 RepID=UPI0034D3E9C9
MSEKMKTVKVKFLKAHKHAGMQYSEGIEVDVPEHDANWLKNLKIAEDAKAPTAPATKVTAEK